MNNLDENIKILRTDLKLTPAEKEQLRFNLLQQLAITPANNWWWQWSILIRIGVPALAVLLLVGGIASAAEGALPGQLLYPVKVNITEPISGKLAITTKAKAEWETKKVSRRLVEAESLVIANKLDEKTQDKLESRWEEASSTFAGLVQKLEEDDDKKEEVAKVKLDFDKEIKNHEQILNKVRKDKKDKENKVELNKIKRKIND